MWGGLERLLHTLLYLTKAADIRSDINFGNALYKNLCKALLFLDINGRFHHHPSFFINRA